MAGGVYKRHPGEGASTNSRGVKRPLGRATRGSPTPPSPSTKAMSEAASEHGRAERWPRDSLTRDLVRYNYDRCALPMSLRLRGAHICRSFFEFDWIFRGLRDLSVAQPTAICAGTLSGVPFPGDTSPLDRYCLEQPLRHMLISDFWVTITGCATITTDVRCP